MEEIAAGEAQGRLIEIWFADEARVGQKRSIAPIIRSRSSAYSCPAVEEGPRLVVVVWGNSSWGCRT